MNTISQISTAHRHPNTGIVPPWMMEVAPHNTGVVQPDLEGRNTGVVQPDLEDTQAGAAIALLG